MTFAHQSYEPLFAMTASTCRDPILPEFWRFLGKTGKKRLIAA